MLKLWQETGGSWIGESLSFCCVFRNSGKSLVHGPRWALPSVTMACGSGLAWEAQGGEWAQI